MKTATASYFRTPALRGRPLRLTFTLLVAIASSILIVPAADAQSAEACRSQRGYIPVGGGQTPYALATGELRTPADLSYTLTCPTSGLAGPAVVIYNAYTDDPDFVAMGQLEDLTRAGYAVVTVATRGVACSGGAFNPFHPDEARDGYDVIEWVAKQPWSNGKIAMMGESAAAITQLPVAALQPPSLDAIAPVQFVTDFYRDVVYPGGIYNQSVAVGWQAFQRAQSTLGLALGSPYSSTQKSPDSVGCPVRQPSPSDVGHQVVDPEYRSQKWNTEFFTDRLSFEDLARIQVPVHAVVAWQDELLSSRSVQLLSHAGNSWAVLTNGTHGTKPGVTKQDRMAFFDHFLKGIDNSFEETPRVKVLWEMGSKNPWVTTYSHWPAPQTKSETFYLSRPAGQPEGALTEEIGTGDSSSYTYDGISGQNRGTWKVRPMSGHSLSFTSAPLTEDLVALGPASLDLWLASTAQDTDLQVTVTEVRQDSAGSGASTETFVQQGWLRASHRALDEGRSTETFPVHTHREQDSQPLGAGPNQTRIEILPFGHVFRAGSRLKITIDAPPRVPSPWWSFDALAGGATNTVLHSGDYLSKLVLSTVPGQPESMPALPPPCGSLVGQPCREM